MEARENNNIIPNSSSLDSKVQFSYYELEFLWTENRKVDTTEVPIIFFGLPTYDIVMTLEEFLEYQETIFTLSLEVGTEMKEICIPKIERVEVEGETLYFCSDLINNINLL